MSDDDDVWQRWGAPEAQTLAACAECGVIELAGYIWYDERGRAMCRFCYEVFVNADTTAPESGL
jgi:hypothetical protein